MSVPTIPVASQSATPAASVPAGTPSGLAALVPGDVLAARVAATLSDGLSRLLSAAGPFNARLPEGIKPGDQLTFQVASDKGQTVLKLVDGAQAAPARSTPPSSSGTQPQSLAPQPATQMARTGTEAQPASLARSSTAPASTQAGQAAGLNTPAAVATGTAVLNGTASVSTPQGASSPGVPVAATASSPAPKNTTGPATAQMQTATKALPPAQRAAVEAMVSRDVVRQDSLVRLNALAGAVMAPTAAGAAMRATLPKAAVEALGAILGLRLDAGKDNGKLPDAAGLKRALQQAGPGADREAMRPGPGAQAAQGQTARSGAATLKESLSQLVKALSGAIPQDGPDGTATTNEPQRALGSAAQKALAGSPSSLNQGAAPGASEAGRPPPPTRAALPAPQAVVPDPVDAEPADLARQIHDAAKDALARMRLTQAASLVTVDASRDGVDQPGVLHAEIPVALPNGTGVLALKVERDGSGAAGEEGNKPVWRLRFAIDPGELGPVHALVSLSGESVSARLWAEDNETAALMGEEASDLVRALQEKAFEVETVRVAAGRPDPAPRVAPDNAAGRYRDLLS